ncbi:MAG: tetratricopeptide repeat protein [Betaproteobacteria bacterium]|nr:MAG: tetratricopeptide repeat protein [Betaproteobacteria bacterium]
MPYILGFLLAAFLALSASAQPSFPELESRAAALEALEDDDARYRAAGVLYIGRTGLAADGPLLVKRLSDEHPVVRAVAEQSVWRVWSRSGDAETDQLLAAGVEEMEIGLYNEAIHTFSNVIKRKPDFAEGWNKRATALFLAGDLRASLADCDEVVKRNPQHFGALSGYGQIYFRLKEYKKSIEYFRRALEVNPNLTELETVIRRLERLMRSKGQRAV